MDFEHKELRTQDGEAPKPPASRRSFRAVLYTVFVISLFFLAVAAGKRYSAQVSIQVELNEFIPEIVKSKKCVFPREYHMGTVDPNFGVSQSEFSSATAKAAAIWRSALGEPLFRESSSSGFVVNLVFDERQQKTRELQTMLSSLATDKEKYNALKKQSDALTAHIIAQKSAYDSEKSAYEKKLSDFNALAAAHNAAVGEYEKEVSKWNASWGAPKGVYEQLNAKRDEINVESQTLAALQADLKAAFSKLDATRQSLNELISQENLLVGILNQYAQKVNEEVATYNAVPREEFEAGQYAKSGEKENITIYQFSNKDDLVKVLAHELGHALGLDHATGTPSAIMYPMMGEQGMALTNGDISMLQSYCGMESK